MDARVTRWRRRVLRSLAVLVVLVLAVVVWNGAQLWLAWRSIDRVDFDLELSRAIVDEVAATVPAEDPTAPDAGPRPEPEVGEPSAPQTVFSDDDVDVFLLIGSDGKAGEGLGRADAVLLFIRPEGGRAPLLMSLPRDLTLVNPCTRRPARLTAALEGCGDEVSGPELLALMVENFTTMRIDHFAVVGFGAFRQVIDRLGGFEICVENESRFEDRTIFPAGCSIADGRATLEWLRSRTPEEFVDGAWQPLAGGDLARSDRQQELLVQLMGRLRDFRSPLEMADLVEDLAGAVVLDRGLSIGAAIDIAWEMRNVNPARIERPALPFREETQRGKFARIPTQPFPELLREVYGP